MSLLCHLFAKIWSRCNHAETLARPEVSLLRIGYFTLDSQ